MSDDDLPLNIRMLLRDYDQKIQSKINKPKRKTTLHQTTIVDRVNRDNRAYHAIVADKRNYARKNLTDIKIVRDNRPKPQATETVRYRDRNGVLLPDGIVPSLKPHEIKIAGNIDPARKRAMEKLLNEYKNYYGGK